MSDFSKFRSSLNGFNRKDVVNYIESASIDHQKQLRKLQDENAKLQAEKQALSEQLAAANSALEQLRQEDASLQQQIECLAKEAADLAILAEASEQASCESSAVFDSDETWEEKELAAYRRAEQAERNAMIRTKKLQAQLSVLCDNARRRYLDSGEEIAALTEDLSAGLLRLQESFAELQAIFDDTENEFDNMDLPQMEEI